MLLEHLPAESSLMTALAPAGKWGSLEARLLAAIFKVLTGKQHPELAEDARNVRAADVTERLERWRQRHPEAVKR